MLLVFDCLTAVRMSLPQPAECTSRHVCNLFVDLARSALCSGILKRWVSRFDVWPYLETFTIDVAHELRAALGAKVSPP